MRQNGFLLPLLIVAAAGVNAGRPVAPTTNCSPYRAPATEDERPDAGPYRLLSARCFDPGKVYDSAPPSVSPDGTHAAWADHAGVTIVDLRSGQNRFIPASTQSLNFRVTTVAAPIAWTPDSTSLWATTREKAASGFPTSGGKVIRLSLDGSRLPVPDFFSPSGPLDAVQWVPGTSIAIVQFGTHGGTYQPTHPDPAPELAMVDTATGSILDRLSLASLHSLKGRPAGSDPRFSLAAVTAVIASGRVHAVVTIRTRAGATRVHWTQGLPAVELPVRNRTDERVSLLPSGKQLLRLIELQPDGAQIFDGPMDPHAPRPEPPKPRAGIVVESISLSTGKSAWSITQSVTNFWKADILEISPNGRYALISWPNRRSLVVQAALIDLRNGATVQMFPMSASGGQAGFTDNGDVIWIRVAGKFRFYRRS